ncbi:probable elongator complex protein 2 [Copidosoma floridanum]|uniref:probable elongator complex protein 2 n=1 Tax=Copidosoma floridanum TaxID=29053 RepID=UPI0006C957BF|nr:probable elongator complex protein 2 [Copidosoma floridanum]
MVKTRYISCACNRLPHAVDWGQNNLVCYAANYAVAICDPHDKLFGSILSTLHVHTDRVNVVRWIKSMTFPIIETELITGSCDGTAIIWTASNLTCGNFEAKETLLVDGPVSICDAAYISAKSSDLLACTCSIDGKLKIWVRFNCLKVELVQAINFSKKLPTEARLVILPPKLDNSTNVILFIALDDSTVDLYLASFIHEDVNQNNDMSFIKVQTLVGHEDWVTCIDIVLNDDESLFAATSSKDSTVRLWKISQVTNSTKTNKGKKLKPKKLYFLMQNKEYEIVLESILFGHDSWVYEVHWHPMVKRNGKYSQPLELLSCSLDKTAIVWKISNNTGVWSEIVRVGEVGGNSLGFYGCKFGPNGKNILAYNYSGSFHMWEYQENFQNWKPRLIPNGHYNSVVDLCWDSKGRFLITASKDQTTRIHVPWPISNQEESWCQISRPQIHGHDISCLAILKPHIFASGAEEKVVRIFTAPLIFKNYLLSLMDEVSDVEFKGIVEAAYLPDLGLTNKAGYEVNLHNSTDTSSNSSDFNYEEPLLEEELIRKTLWPEFQKLYGHGYEIFSMAARHDGTLLATSSKSTSFKHAAIILWDTKLWCQSDKLLFHQLTVTQMAFSPDDQYFLSVSRDRCWALYSYQNHKYELLMSSLQKESFHLRIIWSCSWTNDSKYFATGSRDGKVGIWSKNIANNKKPLLVTDFCSNGSSVTALAFAPSKISNKFLYVLAIGFEHGCIDIRKIEQVGKSNCYEWVQLSFLNTSQAHHAAVKRLCFRPNFRNEHVLQLASCGMDGVVKLHDVVLI